jgi:hypothetical protein
MVHHRRCGPDGGRRWWAHFESTRINIEPIILGKKIEELRVLGALFEHDACIRSPDVSIGRTKINEVASA